MGRHSLSARYSDTFLPVAARSTTVNTCVSIDA